MTPEDERRGLLIRLHDRSDDFAATTELRELDAESARRTALVDSPDSDRLVRQGLSGIERIRIWLRPRGRSQR